MKSTKIVKIVLNYKLNGKRDTGRLRTTEKPISAQEVSVANTSEHRKKK